MALAQPTLATPVAANATAPGVAQTQQPIAITVQMPPPADPHWTAYMTAVATPIVAVVAASIAGYIAYRNWRTAQNKLKLDLFERRMKVLTTIREIMRLIFEDEDRVTVSTYNDLENAVRDAEWVFDEAVHKHLLMTTLRLYDDYTDIKYKVQNIKYKIVKGIISQEESKEMLQTAVDNEAAASKALSADGANLIDLLAPFLRLSH